MIQTVFFEGAKATVRKTNIKILTIAVLATFTVILTGCPDPNGQSLEPGANEAAATVNGKTIKFEAVERAIKQQARGQESQLSPLELAQARLRVLEKLIQDEVLYQKAEGEKTIPTDDEVTAELNKAKTDSKLSKEDWDKRMKEAGETDDSIRANLKKQIAIRKLVEKVAGKVEPPNNSEIEGFYNGNKAAFVKKRGVQLAAIVIDPRNNGNGDTTIDQNSANLKIQEVMKKLQAGTDFATLAAAESEDPSRIRKGDLGYITEEQLKRTFSPQIAQLFMSDQFKLGQITQPFPIAGKAYIFKLQDRNLREEKLTLESPGVRQQITDSLVNLRKQLLSQSYGAIAMNEAKIENFLAKRVVSNPNELSGARPASPTTDSNTAPAANANANTASNSNAAVNTNANADDKSGDNANAESDKKDDKK